MPISSTENREVYSGNGVTTVFPYPHYFLADADLVVLKTEVATGVVTTLALTTDYTLTGAGDENGGSVTALVAPASGFKITIYRDPEITQTQDFEDLDSLPESALERPLDKLTMIAQRQREISDRSFRLADGDVSGADLTVPSPQASYYIRWKADGSGFENSALIPDGAVGTATETTEGIVERLTLAEAKIGTDTVRYPSIATLTALLGPLFASRMTVANGSDATGASGDLDHDLTISPGAGVSSDATAFIFLAAAITKRADATFAEGTGNGGMVSGESLPADGVVGVWAISKADGTTDVCFNNYATSAMAPTLPSGFVNKRFLGHWPTDASNNFYRVTQLGDYFHLRSPGSPALDISSTAISNSSTTYTLNKVPKGASVEVDFHMRALNSAATVGIYVRNPNDEDIAVAITGAPLATLGSGASNVTQVAKPGLVTTNSSGQIAARASQAANNTFMLAVTGWRDHRV